MAYAEDVTEPLIRTLSHTAGLPVHQLAGHAANLGFWVAEVEHAFQVLDGYKQRFRNLQQGERRHFEETGIGWPHPAGPPVRPGITDHQLKELRRQLADAIYRVLSRCYKHSLVNESGLEQFAQRLSLSAEEIKREK